MERQLAQCRELMNDAGLDALLLRTRSNFAWMTDGRDNHIEIEFATGVADLVVFPDRVLVVTAEIEARRIAEEEIRDLPVELVSTSWTQGVDPTLLALLRGRRVGADVPYPGATFVGPMLTRLRRRLGHTQIEQYKGLCLDAAQVIEEVAKNIEPAQTEFSIGGRLMQGLAERAARRTLCLSPRTSGSFDIVIPSRPTSGSTSMRCWWCARVVMG
ncbi:aminopeptidase P family N-terminal domain-containing protein [Alicyclobacillus fastidiosus]|uniref:aminopeptidase P family N-terminal domain-containing protein n=1 Tax=Alicyclobacillus fastidiosus TaxID=392011 RepID=UPI0023E9A027|nr:aminopeptidase P family N-terminal domain-containing protein [Alicyclobacillus fastidiosus]GMA62454.1 hypothetical protein GCM10025859_28940 [Alicyclobacillus fastidiosus]